MPPPGKPAKARTQGRVLSVPRVTGNTTAALGERTLVVNALERGAGLRMAE
ncbi:hypothetical protein [Streptomyces hygroscopicus]|uniref:hypothetical protein n=1 Tax=Streptomyces hygroscopicus TaxID=1912 RepID=UPI00340D1979